MLRLTLVCLVLHLLHIYCYRYTLAQNLSEIQARIEKQRQIAMIVDKIHQELVKNGAKISRSDAINRLETSKGGETSTKVEFNSQAEANSESNHYTNGRSKELVTLGEPVSKARDKCLAFHIRKYVKDVEYIIPKKIDLWIHIRKRENTKKKKTNKQTEKMLKNGKVERKKDEDNSRIEEQKVRRKNRKKRHGRRIKIFISDGTKTLVKMRMRIRKTKWYKIELPISQFPDVISVNDSFKLCFKCKRCSKKIKMDLYRKGVRELNAQVPFIHFEEPRSQHTFRYKRSSDVERSSDVKRSSDVINMKHRHHHSEQSRYSQNNKTCCHEDIYVEELSNLFPSIVYPESLNISFCTGVSEFYKNQPILSQISKSQTPIDLNYLCVPTVYESFTFVYINKDFSVKHASIPDLIPTGCTCRRAR